MKDKYLKIRMTEEELSALKEFTKNVGFKNTSEAVRESLNAFKVIKEREPIADKETRYCDISSILFSIKQISSKLNVNDYLVNPIEYFSSGLKVDDELKEKVITLDEEGTFDILKEIVLRSIYHDLVFGRELEPKIKKLIKDILIENLKA